MESEMTQPAKVTEPSMEEILASIRRIIADDEAKPPPTEAAKPEKAAAPGALKTIPRYRCEVNIALLLRPCILGRIK